MISAFMWYKRKPSWLRVVNTHAYCAKQNLVQPRTVLDKELQVAGEAWIIEQDYAP